MIKPLETEYNSHKFRSRTEARYAVLFHELGVKYDYELEGFNLDGDWYLPDFWLPEFQCWIEVKGDAPSAEEIGKCQRLAQATNKLVYLFYGTPWYDLDPDEENGILFDSQGQFPAQFIWMRCLSCGHLGIGNIVVIPFSDMTTGQVSIGDCYCEAFYGVITANIEDAYITARQARFEHRKEPVPYG